MKDGKRSKVMRQTKEMARGPMNDWHKLYFTILLKDPAQMRGREREGES